MRIFDRLDVEERELPPLPAYQTVSWEKLVSPTPGANVVEDAGVDLDDVWAADESMSRANSGPFSASASASASAEHSHALTQPPPHSELHLAPAHQPPTQTLMAFFGLRKWPTPVSCF